MSTKKVRLGIVGVGGMGSAHVSTFGDIRGIEVVGVCDIDKGRADSAAEICKCTAYYDHLDMFARANLDAVMIATPHYDHTTVSVNAFKQGLHVLSEKPLAVHVNDAKKSIDAYEAAKAKNPNLVFAIMFQTRLENTHRKIKELLEDGELGRLVRVTWINTAWFRSQAYYDSGGWRASWAGEGGGILTNQCPHNLDMYQWLFGLPAKITGRASLGKYHNIEVEDEVSAIFEHENGMIGHFIVSTSECPGTNRLEIIGENGKLVMEKGLIFYRNRKSMIEHSKETKNGFEMVENWYTEIPIPNYPGGHAVVTQKFIDAILNETPNDVVAHGADGIRSVTLANGIMLSSFLGKTIDVPIDADAFEMKLKELISTSTYVKPGDQSGAVVDFTDSWKK
jgi:predicted dehydrogenase